jgi:hypothetical protein
VNVDPVFVLSVMFWNVWLNERLTAFGLAWIVPVVPPPEPVDKVTLIVSLFVAPVPLTTTLPVHVLD